MKKIYFLLVFIILQLTLYSQVVINEVYGGGNNSGAPYRNDFVELFNNSSTAVSISSWRVEYFSAGGNSGGSAILPTNASIAPGGYYLIQLAGGTVNGIALPTPDATGTMNMSASNGRVDLFDATGSLTDRVGFGTSGVFEGSASAPTLNNTVSAQRSPEGNDTDDNRADFVATAPTPRNSSTVETRFVSAQAGADASEPSGNGHFIINLSAPAPADGVTVTYTLGGTATEGSDYEVGNGGSVFIESGMSSARIDIIVIDDDIAEGTETVELTIVSATAGYTIQESRATISILDNEMARIALTGKYLQNFNTLAASGTSNVLPEGWLLFEQGSNANGNYTAGTGSSNAGDTYSFGPASDADRALGSVQSGSLISSFGAVFTNNTGNTINRLLISYDGEQWRLGTAGRADRLDFHYSNDATDLSNGSWTAVPELSFSTPNTTTVGAKDGNAAENRATVSFVIAGLAISPGQSFFIRWSDFNAAGADDGLAVDNLLVEANPIDIDPPQLTELYPAAGANDIPLNPTLTAFFNEQIEKGAGEIIIRNSSTGEAVRSVDILDSDVQVSGNRLSIPLSQLTQNQSYSVEFGQGVVLDLEGNSFAGIQGQSWTFTTGTTLFSTDFSNCGTGLPDGFTQFSLVGPQVWSCTPFGRDSNNLPSGSAPSGVQINGFEGTNIPNEDWLISPPLNLTGTTYPLLSFWSRVAFNGLPLSLKISTDYSGGDPSTATWQDINGRFPAQATNIWTFSSGINLAAFKQEQVYIAFVYYSSEDEGARWTLDDIRVENSPIPPPPAITLAADDVSFQFVAPGEAGIRSVIVRGDDLTDDLRLQVNGNFAISLDSTNFSSTLIIPSAEANNQAIRVFVQFTPTEANQNFEGLVKIETSAIADTISLKGTSIDPATTLEVVNWNIEWFGSEGNGPVNDDQQQSNVIEIMRNINADIYGLVEIVSEERLAAVVSQLPGYSYVISEYGSHTNTAVNPPGALRQAQKLAYVYRSDIFSNVMAEPILSAGINTPQDITNPAYNYWASGRFPYMLSADVTLNCVTEKMRFVLVHAKANTSPTATSYQRRKNGSDTLYQVLNELYPDDKIVVFGDINDDLDQSITSGFTTTSWDAFTSDSENYEPVTLPLSLAGKKSTVSYNDVIDHVIISSELEPYYLESSASILSDVTGLVSNFGSSTSDHYPVLTRYQFSTASAPEIVFCPPSDTLCESADNIYQFPVISASSDGCDNVKYTYTVSGATNREGSGADASGTFSPGLSIIDWTVTNASGVSATCQTSVLIRPKPAVSIPDSYAYPEGVRPNTVYVGYQPARSITLFSGVTGDTSNYTYNWSAGNISASILVTPVQDTRYTVRVTDSLGCSASDSILIRVEDVRAGNKGQKVQICKKTGIFNRTLEVSSNAVAAHLRQGALLGSCRTSDRYEAVKELVEQVREKLEAIAYPNPSKHEFFIELKGLLGTRISYRVTDAYGRLMERQDNVNAGSLLRLGSGYRPGMYVVEITAGDRRFVLRLIKTS